MTLRTLADARLVMISGKGGTGKTTTAAALAANFAAQGKRTLLVEVDSQRSALSPIFGFEPGFEPKAVTDHLSVANFRWEDALVNYLKGVLPVGPVIKAILANDVVGRFLEFTPGSQELVVLDALEKSLATFDQVVVDMPASGHAFSMLDILRSAVELFRGGPIRKRALELQEFIRSSSTRLLLVALPEEMVVNETLETAGKFKEAALLSQPAVFMLNRAYGKRFDEAARVIISDLAQKPLDTASRSYGEGALFALDRQDAAGAALRRLSAVGEEPLCLPPLGLADRPRNVVRRVAEVMAADLGTPREGLSWI